MREQYNCQRQMAAAPAAILATPARSGESELQVFLHRHRLGHVLGYLESLGAERPTDLVDVLPEDLIAAGLSKLERNRWPSAMTVILLTAPLHPY